MALIYIHQPDFIPWPVFFRRIAISDIFVILDHVQFNRRGWQNRDRIKTAQGSTWLTVPVKKKTSSRLNQVEIVSEQEWKNKHLRSLQTWYGKTPFFREYFQALQEIYLRTSTLLIELNMDLIHFFLEVFGLKPKMVFSSSLPVQGQGTQLLVQIIKAVKGDAYLTGSGARDYLEEHLFAQDKITLIWDEIEYPWYPQRFKPFIPRLSSIDFLFNCGSRLTEYFIKNIRVKSGGINNRDQFSKSNTFERLYLGSC